MTAKLLKNYIGGTWVESKSKETVDVLNPATGEKIGQTLLSTAGEVNEAVKAAQNAFPDWRKTPPLTRARYLYRLKTALEDNFEELAKLTTIEAGKTLDESRGELRRAIEMVEVALGIPSMMRGYNLEDVAEGIDCSATRQPLGVFAAIAPYNFPLMVPFWFWPFAVACGNTYIVKPSEQDPLSQQKICEVNAILENPNIKGVSFVGSSAVAKIIYKKCGETGKRVQSLGGAKNFAVIMPDANIDAAVPAIIGSAFGCAGQRCLATSVALTVGESYEPFKKAMANAASKIKVGFGLDESVQMGPVISNRHKERVLSYIEKGVQEGAELILDGRKIKVSGSEGGFFVGPTIFDKVKAEMAIAREEIFGPVLAIIQVKNLDEALEIIQKNEYGNASSIFTKSGKSARDFKYKVPCSMTGVNIGIPAPMAFFPFGGNKGSFFGDIKGHGPEIVDFFTDKKIVIERWN
ncbi:MAG: CoA-acylating methylmalonate-semialdehyde dehydrogenase [Deltaproteobacteria bacterium]|nr:CoA-acylating methylmalonate-semialdehyde dehydrogenase [Deltaproteobacteria bacterium]